MNHILVENTYFTNHIEWTKHKIMFKYQIFGIVIILKTFLLAISSIIHFFLLSKNFVKNIFHRAEDNISKRKDNYPFKYLFTIWFTQLLEKHFIELCNTRKSDLACSIEQYHFEELLQSRSMMCEIKYLNKLQHFAKYLGKSFSIQNNSKRFLSV